MQLSLRGGGQLERYLQRAARDHRVAIARAGTRTVEQVQTRASRAIATDTGLPVRQVRAATKVEPARPERLVATLSVAGARIPIADRAPSDGVFFRARQTARGVSYRVGRRGRSFVPGGFLQTMQSGHRGTFKRQGAKRVMRHGRYAGKTLRSGRPLLRQPIVQLFGPSLPHVARQQRVDDTMRDAKLTILPRLIEHELRFARRSGRP